MKILFDHPNPFSLAHGGFQTQIEQTKLALQGNGIEVEYLRWWDSQQTGDIIHFFGRASNYYIDFAHTKKIKVVMSELLTGVGSRSTSALYIEKTLIKLAKQIAPESFISRFAWDSYQKADAFVALTTWEAYLMNAIFTAPIKHIHVVPNGVETTFFKRDINTIFTQRKNLVCTATIAPRKRVLELAQAAILAETPILFIGRPYSETDYYYLDFLELHKQHPSIIQYAGAIQNRSELASIYQSSRGFVLLSTMESLSLSALEAAATSCPLLLSDLPWARHSFGNNAYYCRITNPKATATTLYNFYHQKSPKLPELPLTWGDVAHELIKIYQSLLI